LIIQLNDYTYCIKFIFLRMKIFKIRFPKDLYLELKMEAAKRELSIAALVRERLANKIKEN